MIKFVCFSKIDSGEYIAEMIQEGEEYNINLGKIGEVKDERDTVNLIVSMKGDDFTEIRFTYFSPYLDKIKEEFPDIKIVTLEEEVAA